jgi:exodeoxyribonuclease V alpha subunit
MEQSSSTFEGVIERIVYTSDEDGWSVVRLAVKGRHDLVTAVGTLPGVQPGESLRLRGEWVVDRKYGEQFRVDSFLTVKPSTLVGIEKYLSSGLVKGIGAVMAARLVAHFGLGTLDVIEEHPERLTEVEGIGPIRSERIRRAWEEQRKIKDVMLFLQSHGISSTFAIKIYRQYGDGAISAVKNNPYQLAVDIFGIGFKTADRIAATLGVSPTSPQRAEAGILFVLGEMSDDGHLYVPRERLVEEAKGMLEIEAPIIDHAVDRLARGDLLVIEPLPGGGEAVYLASLHTAEVGAARRLSSLIEAEIPPLEIDIERAIAWFEQREGIALARAQREAIRCAVTAGVLIITGGPGTGKTTLVNGFIQILERKGRRILLCAPTGRAAKRMNEATGREAKTIHRLLEFSPRAMEFTRDQSNPLDADMVVVDEVSMVDAVLFYHLLKALPPQCQLILVGDVDQLPSVGPGCVLRDLIASGRVEVVRLTEIFRQARESLIVVNAHRVNRGEMPLLRGVGGREDFFFIEREEPQEILELLKDLIAEKIPRRFGIDPLEDLQLVTPMHRGLIGARHLNAELQQLLNPDGAAITRGSRTFRVGDRVMQIRNNYLLDVYNGDIGRIEGIDDVEKQVCVRFEDRRVEYDYADLDELVLAYACSIHKSQGSEFPVVVMPIHTQHYVMLQRNLLYTGITRGRRAVILVGTRRALAIAVKNSSVGVRYSRLAERLAGLPPISP